MRFLSLFAGIGGFDLGLERAGWQCVGQVEIDPFCQRVLAKHWPSVPRWGDVKGVTGKDILTRLAMMEDNESAIVEGEMSGYHKLSKDQIQQAVTMYEAGLSCGDIAALFKVSRQSMHDVLKRRTTMRPQLRFGGDNHFYRGGVSAEDRVHNITEKAMERGALVRAERCETCGKTYRFSDGRNAIQAHHPDYNQPLQVMWLCQKCHHEWHKNNIPIKMKENSEPPAIDAIVGGFP